MVEIVITIFSGIALPASLVACALWWEAGKRIDELEMSVANMNLRVTMAETVIRRTDKRLEDK